LKDVNIMAKRKTPTEANDQSGITGDAPVRPARASRRRAPRETATGDTFTARPADDRPPDAAADQSRAGSTAQPNEDDIRMRAYMRYLERGRLHGLEFDDWLEAERELKSKKN
jgi:hypothetical protein